MPVAPFPTDVDRTAIARAYKNDTYVAERVLPVVPVNNREFSYISYPDETFYSAPDTRVGRRSRPNEITSSGVEVSARAEWHALSDPIPIEDITNTDESGIDVLAQSTEILTEAMLLGREKRVAEFVFDANQYPNGYKITLSGTSQWNDFANSDPLGVIETAIQAPLVQPNIMVLSAQVWSVLRRHPHIVAATGTSGAERGRARREAVADLLELEEIIVAPSRINTAPEGQAPQFQRLWGKHCALLYRNRIVSSKRGMTWGFIGRFKDFTVGQVRDELAGAQGVIHNKITLCESPVVMAPLAGYLIQNAVA